MINISKHRFTKEQYYLLNNNLSFYPTTGHYNESILKKDLESFERKIKLQEQKQETKLANKDPSIKSKTNWEPKKNHHTVEMFIEAVNKDVVERLLLLLLLLFI